ncbi:MAG TPA: hypothetical protein VNC41_14555, partial [Acidimicrobiia bacterium]|nr:hypothetical protein [Acidimicrobiia bacterium]
MTENDAQDLPQEVALVEFEPEPRNRTVRATIVGVVVVACVASAIGVWVLRSDESSSPARALPVLPVLGANAEASRSAAADAKPFAPIEYSLATNLPDLGATGLVYRVGAPRSAADAATAIAAALGIEGTTVERDGTAEVVGANRTVTVSNAGPLTVSIYDSVPTTEPARGGSAPDAGTGSGASPGVVDGSDGSTDVAKEAPVVVDEPRDEVPTIDAPTNLPSAAGAEQIARELLNRIGVEGDYEAEVSDGGSVGVATACVTNSDCPPAAEPIVTSRSVILFRTIDGQRVSGLEWYVDVGDEGVVGSVTGTLTSLETVGDYPLRSVAAAYEALRRGETAGSRDLVAKGSPDSNVDVPAIAPLPDVTVEPQRVAVSGATRGTIFIPTYESGGPTAYLVPSYRFEGTFQDGTPWSAEVIAIDEKYVVTPPTDAP